LSRIAAAAALAALLAGGDLHADAASVEVRGSELVVSTAGRVLARPDLIGAVLALAQEGGVVADVRIDRIATDPERIEGDVVLYDLSVADDDGAWVPACPAEPDGMPHAVLQPRPGGSIVIFCTAGARGKCIRMGYRPWAARDGVPLAPYWEACIKLIRADYCGDDQPMTLDGMLISIYDTLGIQQRDNRPDFAFEAAWDARGALCVAHPRVPQNITLDALAAACPRLADHLGAGCTEAAAKRLGTPLLYNASRGDGVPEQVR
jgi:ADYC domain